MFDLHEYCKSIDAFYAYASGTEHCTIPSEDSPMESYGTEPDSMIRKAQIKDIKTIHGLLQIYGNRGQLLPRPLSKLYDHVRDFSVYEENGRVMGCCALQFCWEYLAEIRSLAVHPDHVGKGIGMKLAEDMLAEARSYSVKMVFTLTYQPGFFEKMGFRIISKSKLPLKIWSDCIQCVKFPECDETAMMMEI